MKKDVLIILLAVSNYRDTHILVDYVVGSQWIKGTLVEVYMDEGVEKYRKIENMPPAAYNVNYVVSFHKTTGILS